MKHSILCVDDEADNAEALERLFRGKYHVLTANSGPEALKLIQKDENRISLIISDQRMPQMEGTDFLKKSMNYAPEAIRILLTGFADIGSVIEAINSGEVFRYMMKPWDPVDLRNTVDKAIERFELSSELKIKNRTLKKALSELQTLDTAKTHFMYLINHELKTPLTVLRNFQDLLLETPLDEEQKQYMKKISLSLERLQKIVEDVLELSSAELGLFPLHMSPLSIEPIFRELIQKYTKQAGKRSLSFDFQVPATPLRIQADKAACHKILSHLIENAIKFAHPATQITCGFHLKDTKGHIYIHSFGKEMDEATIEHILKPFSLNEKMFHHSKNLGLGLSLCQALLKHHNSELRIKSDKEQIKIEFELPLSPES